MNNRRPQDLPRAFTSIISMLLMTIRARGWRGFKDLPKLLLGVLFVRRMGEAFAELKAAFRAGTLPPPAPAPVPAPWSDPPEWDAAGAQSPAPQCAAARPDPAARARRRPAERRSAPVAEAGADPAREVKTAGCAALSRPTRVARVARVARATRARAAGPFAVLMLPVGIFATGRSSKALPWRPG